MLLVSYKMVFLENEVALLLQFSVELFCLLFTIKKFTFCGALFKRILAWERGTSKT